MIARVFPTRTSMTPIDEHAYYAPPDMFTPKYDEVHISCVFTWDKVKAERLAYEWQDHGKVIIGGPAYNSYAGEFFSGKYLKKGITITSRGCPNKCNFCLVPSREGLLRELEIIEGNIIQDNNILACSETHLQKVFAMLKTQRAIEFKGGLEARRITHKIAKEFAKLRIKTLWLACDTKGAINQLKKAVQILNIAGFNRNKIYSFVLIGDDMKENEERLREVYSIGAKPFAQLFQPADRLIEYSKEWKQFARKWSRPAIYQSIMKAGNN
jgi:hypothetical protein